MQWRRDIAEDEQVVWVIPDLLLSGLHSSFAWPLGASDLLEGSQAGSPVIPIQELNVLTGSLTVADFTIFQSLR